MAFALQDTLGTFGSVETYKLLLGYGARSGNFQIRLTFPKIVDDKFLFLPSLEGMRVMGHKITFPSPREVQTEECFFDGESFKIASQRQIQYNDLVISFRDNEFFYYRKMFLTWMEHIQTTSSSDKSNVGTSVNGGSPTINQLPLNVSLWKVDKSYKQDMNIVLFDELEGIQFQIQCFGVFPKTLTGASILDVSDNALFDNDVTLSVDKYVFQQIQPFGSPINFIPSALGGLIPPSDITV